MADGRKSDGQVSGEQVFAEQGEAVRVYLRLKQLFGGQVRHSRKRPVVADGVAASVPYGAGRDPRELGSIMDSLTEQLGWNSPLAQSDLLASWPNLAGEETAQHAMPVGISGGVLTVQCESTAWATQLRIMRSAILTRILERYPDAGVETIRFQGPNTPSWKRGPRSIPGRGPRDTYG